MRMGACCIKCQQQKRSGPSSAPDQKIDPRTINPWARRTGLLCARCRLQPRRRNGKCRTHAFADYRRGTLPAWAAVRGNADWLLVPAERSQKIWRTRRRIPASAPPTSGPKTGIAAQPQSEPPLPALGRMACAMRGPRSRAGTSILRKYCLTAFSPVSCRSPGKKQAQNKHRCCPSLGRHAEAWYAPFRAPRATFLPTPVFLVRGAARGWRVGHTGDSNAPCSPSVRLQTRKLPIFPESSSPSFCATAIIYTTGSNTINLVFIALSPIAPV